MLLFPEKFFYCSRGNFLQLFIDLYYCWKAYPIRFVLHPVHYYGLFFTVTTYRIHGIFVVHIGHRVLHHAQYFIVQWVRMFSIPIDSRMRIGCLVFHPRSEKYVELVLHKTEFLSR